MENEKDRIKKESRVKIAQEKEQINKEKERVKYLATQLQTAMDEIRNDQQKKTRLKHRRSRSAFSRSAN